MFSLELSMGQFAEFCANIIFFPLLLCIHSTCVGLQAPNLKEKVSQSQQMCFGSWGQNFALLSACACFLSENIHQVKSTCSLAHVQQKMCSTYPMFHHLKPRFCRDLVTTQISFSWSKSPVKFKRIDLTAALKDSILSCFILPAPCFTSTWNEMVLNYIPASSHRWSWGVQNHIQDLIFLDHTSSLRLGGKPQD